MSLSTTIIKFLLLLFNVLCLICGLILTVIGTIMVLQIKDVSSFAEMVSMNTVAITALTIGALVVTLSLVGSFGTLREKEGQLRIYSVVMLILFLVQVAFAIYLWEKYDDILGGVLKFIQTVFDQRATDFKVLHTLERFLKCCGANGDNDYFRYGEDIPGSCCGLATAVTCRHPFPVGCKNAITFVWHSNARIIKHSALILSGIMVTVSLMATYMARKINEINTAEE